MKKVWLMLLTVLTAAFLHAEHETGEKLARYEKWLEEKSEKLLKKGQTVMTLAGPVQYTHEGSSSRILMVLHGAFGGWDQGQLISERFHKEGFSILSVSRPGYLGTPLPDSLPPFVEFTPEQQAEVLIALLDVLKIDKVFLLGFSAGAPVAYALAKNYPERVKALVMQSLGASPREDFLFYTSLWNSFPLPAASLDFVSYLLYLSERFDFNSAVKEALSHDTSLTGQALYERIRLVTHHHEKYTYLKKLLETMSPFAPRLPGIKNDFLGENYWTTSFDPTGFTVPTLIVQALDDANGYFPIVQQVVQQLPSAQLFPVQASGHFIWFGPHSKAWKKKIINFLNENNNP